MLRVLVTGPIASGKSEVCKVFSSMGYPVYDSDSRCKALYESVPGLKSEIEGLLGVPFSQIGVIFSDSEKRLALERKVYPLVREDFHGYCRKQYSDIVFFESAIAWSKEEFRGEFDRTVLVVSDKAVRFSRNSKAAERDALQGLPPQADYVIENDGNLDSLKEKAKDILSKLVMDNKTDLSKILSVSGKHGLFRYLAQARGGVVAESLGDGKRTMLDARSRISALSDISIYTDNGDMKLKEVLTSLKNTVGEGTVPDSKLASDEQVRELFDKAVPGYDADRFHLSHMRKILSWYQELSDKASLDFEEENKAENAEA